MPRASWRTTTLATGPGQRDQVLEQQRGDAAAVHAVGHGQRDLRGRRVAGELVAGHPDQVVAPQAEQGREALAVIRQTRWASRSADTRLALKNRKYRLSGDIASCSRRTAW